jgi:hypothetical protein
MYKKVIVIVFLASSLAAFLYLRPYFNTKPEEPHLVDRLPDADFMGKAYLLDVARETSAMLHYNKIPFRDFFSYEFLLGQGKSYGLNFQNPLYLFANENGNWGVIIEVSDSSKISNGLERLSKIIAIKDTLINGQKVYIYPEESGYLSYGRNWLLLYKGTGFKSQLKRVLNAKRDEIAPSWKAFLKHKQFKDEKLVLYSNWSKMKDYGVETAIFAHDSDSVSFRLLSYVRNKKELNIATKKTGQDFASKRYTDKSLNIHLDITRLKKDPSDPLYKLLVKLGRKISFPTVEFMNAWEGDLSFRQGGTYNIKETFVESVLDDNFNITEIKSMRNIKVPGFSAMLSVNRTGDLFIERLLTKGILRKEAEKYYFLLSPPLNMTQLDNNLIFYSGEFVPRVVPNSSNYGIWNERGTKVHFDLDSLSKHEVFGSIYIPVERILRRNRFF